MTKASRRRSKSFIKRRPTKTELELRHVEIASMLLARYSRAEIVQFSSKKWGVTSRQADKYIAAGKILAEREIKVTPIEQANALFDLKRLARQEKDRRLELDIQKDIGKLAGVYPDPKLKVSDWRDDIIVLLREGKITAEMVRETFDAKLSGELLVAAGLGSGPG